MATEQVQIQLHRDTAANWTSTNPVMLPGEPGVELDTGKTKNGNGTSAWNDIPYPYADHVELAAAVAAATTSPVNYDSLLNRISADLASWNAWLVASGVAGIVEETGWPGTTDTDSWNKLADRYFRKLTARGIPSSLDVSGRLVGTSNALGCYVSAASNTDLDTVKPNALAYEKVFASPQIFRSITIAGGDAASTDNSDTPATLSGGQTFSNLFPGVLGVDYAYPSANDLIFLARRGYTVIKVPVRWERLQSTLLSALNGTEVTRITTLLTNAAAAGVKVVLAMANKGSYAVGVSSTNVNVSKVVLFSGGTVTMAMFADFWSRMATAFGSNPALYGYALLNKAFQVSEVILTGSELQTNTGFETDTSSWAGYSGTTIARDTTQFHSGVASLKLTAGGTGYAGAVATTAAAVTAGTQYQVSAWFRAATVARSVAIQCDWHNSGGTFLSSSYSNFLTENVGSWILVTGTITAPTGATTVNLTPRTDVTVPPVNEVHNVDDIQIFAVSGTYTAPQVWEQQSQAAVTAIRAVDTAHELWVCGSGYSRPSTITTDHPAPWITDSAGRTRYSVRHFFDPASASPGLYTNSYAAELAAAVTAGF